MDGELLGALFSGLTESGGGGDFATPAIKSSMKEIQKMAAV